MESEADRVVFRRSGALAERINLDAYLRMRRVRSPQLCQPNYILDHPLLGTRLPEVEKNHRVIRVSKQWWAGFYLAITYEDDSGSHGVVWRNINSIHPSITGEYEDEGSTNQPN
jgi:hypothetical protein